MSLDAWHSHIRKAWYHIEKRQYYYTFDYLMQAHLAWIKMPKPEIMDETIYNQWADMVDFLRIVGRLPIVVLNEYYIHIVENIGTALEAFENIPHSDNAWSNFSQQVQGKFHYLLKGLQLAAMYVAKQDLDFDGDDKVLSFEFLPGGKIQLYGWTDSPSEGTAEAEEEAETIAYIAEDFNELFVKPVEEENTSSLVLAERYLQKADYNAAISQFLLAIKEDENKSDSVQIAIYEHLYTAYYALGKFREALDMLMKAHLLGLGKRAIRQRIVEICDIMLSKEDIKNNAENLERWQILREDFA